MPFCKDGYYQDDFRQRCMRCHATCVTCKPPGNDLSCTSCDPNNEKHSFLQEVVTTTRVGRCTVKCQDGYFLNPQSKECDLCHGKCSTCTGNLENQCVTCKDGQFLDRLTSRCLEECPIESGTY